MSRLNPQKLHVHLSNALSESQQDLPRRYTLTHSDRTGDLFLTIAQEYDQKKLSDWYTRLMRDEVLAEVLTDDPARMDVFVHTSGGFILGTAKWRDGILRHHMPMALNALCFGDIGYLSSQPELINAPVFVHFHAKQAKYNRIEQWGVISDYLEII